MKKTTWSQVSYLEASKAEVEKRVQDAEENEETRRIEALSFRNEAASSTWPGPVGSCRAPSNVWKIQTKLNTCVPHPCFWFVVFLMDLEGLGTARELQHSTRFDIGIGKARINSPNIQALLRKFLF